MTYSIDGAAVCGTLGSTIGTLLPFRDQMPNISDEGFGVLGLELPVRE